MEYRHKLDNDLLEIAKRILLQNEVILKTVFAIPTIVAVTTEEERNKVFEMLEKRVKEGDYMPLNMQVRIDLLEDNWKQVKFEEKRKQPRKKK